MVGQEKKILLPLLTIQTNLKLMHQIFKSNYFKIPKKTKNVTIKQAAIQHLLAGKANFV